MDVTCEVSDLKTKLMQLSSHLKALAPPAYVVDLIQNRFTHLLPKLSRHAVGSCKLVQEVMTARPRGIGGSRGLPA